MKLEFGKYYKDRNEEVHGPLRKSRQKDFPFFSDTCARAWDKQGYYYGPDSATSLDLIQEVNPDGSPIEPEAKTWGKMTPEEQGALLLAHHNGETIEFLSLSGRWTVSKETVWGYSYEYRVKPKPEVKAEVVHWGPYLFDTHKITFDTIDGEPDVSTVKMEKL